MRETPERTVAEAKSPNPFTHAHGSRQASKQSGSQVSSCDLSFLTFLVLDLFEAHMVSFVCLAFSMDESYHPPRPGDDVPISREEVITDLGPRFGSERTGPLPWVPGPRVRRILGFGRGTRQLWVWGNVSLDCLGGSCLSLIASV